MLAGGTELYLVSEVRAHASVAMTKDVYGLLVEGQKRAAAAPMSTALLGEIGSQTAPVSVPAVTDTATGPEPEPGQGECWRTRRDWNRQPSDP